jgi:hypothetical protein
LKLQTSNPETITSVRHLLNFAIQFSHQLGDASFGRIPGALICDMLEGRTFSEAETLWEIVESFASELTDPAIFAKGMIWIQ